MLMLKIMDYLEIDPIISSDDQIKISWNEVGVSYQLFVRDELIYEGEDASYQHDNLEDSTPYHYVIKALDEEGEIIDQVNIKTMTRPKKKTELMSKLSKDTLEKMKENPLSDMQIDTVTSDKMIVIDWPDIDGVDNYRIYRNEEFLEETNESKVVDEQINAGEKYIYRIVAKRPMSEEVKKAKLQEMKESGLDEKLISEDSFYQTMTIIREIDLNDTEAFANPVPAPKKWQLRYRTFIPEDYVPNPFPDYNYAYFGGDGKDRSFDAEDDRYRTHAELRVCIFCSVDGTGATVGITKIDVHPTTGYDANYKLVKVATASDRNIKFRYEPLVDTKKGEVEYVFDHAAPNALVPGPDIDYYYHAKFFGGAYRITGGNDFAPSHEFFIIKPGSNKWELKYGSVHVDFNMLFPPLDNFFDIAN